MVKINITCHGCKSQYQVTRTEEIPEDVTALNCNWCPICEDNATDDYNEWYKYEPIQEPKDPNQLTLFNEP